MPCVTLVWPTIHRYLERDFYWPTAAPTPVARLSVNQIDTRQIKCAQICGSTFLNAVA